MLWLLGSTLTFMKLIRCQEESDEFASSVPVFLWLGWSRFLLCGTTDLVINHYGHYNTWLLSPRKGKGLVQRPPAGSRPAVALSAEKLTVPLHT